MSGQPSSGGHPTFTSSSSSSPSSSSTGAQSLTNSPSPTVSDHGLTTTPLVSSSDPTSPTSSSTSTSPTSSPSSLPSTTSSSSPTSTTLSSSVSSTAPISATSSSTFPASSTSILQSTSVGVSNGVTFTSIITETTTLVPGAVASGSPPTHQNTNVGAIVGGVVGGVGGLVALILIGFLFIRWRRKRKLEEDFDGDFDPGRVTATGGAVIGGTLPNINVPEEDDGMGGRLAASDLGIRGTVTPFFDARHSPVSQPQMSEKARMFVAPDDSYGYSQGGPSSSHGHGPTAFSIPHTGSAPGSSSSDAGYPPTARSSSVAGYYSRSPLQPQQQQQFYSSSSSEITSSRGAKEREAQPLVSNPDEGTSVVVHHDGGRVDEIPPAYDSLPPSDRR